MSASWTRKSRPYISRAVGRRSVIEPTTCTITKPRPRRIATRFLLRISLEMRQRQKSIQSSAIEMWHDLLPVLFRHGDSFGPQHRLGGLMVGTSVGQCCWVCLEIFWSQVVASVPVGSTWRKSTLKNVNSNVRRPVSSLPTLNTNTLQPKAYLSYPTL